MPHAPIHEQNPKHTGLIGGERPGFAGPGSGPLSAHARIGEFPDSIPCPLGGPEMTPRLWFPRVWTQSSGRAFALYWSDPAGFGSLFPAPTPEELARFYDVPEYDGYMAGAAASGRPAWGAVDRILNHVAWRVDRSDPVTAQSLHSFLGRPSFVCDIGCGSALDLMELKRHGHRVLGIDPSPVARAAALERGVTVLEGTGEQLPPDCPRGAFDLVMMVQSLEHCRRPLAALENAASLLRPGGTLMAEVPNHECVGFQLSGPAWFHSDAGRHLHFFTRRSLEAAVRQVGLTPFRTSFVGYSRQYLWLEAEQQVWDGLYRDRQDPDAGFPTPARPTRARNWKLLARTLLAPPENKYDSVRVYARIPGGPERASA